MIDPRIEQADQIIASLLSPTLVDVSDMVITEDNLLIIITDNTVLYTTHLKDCIVGEPIGLTYNLIGKFSNIELSKPAFIGTEVYIKVINQYKYYTELINHSVIISQDDDLLSNETFEDYKLMKASDGMRYFPMPNSEVPGASCFVPMLPGLVKLNKGDKAGIKVYLLNDRFRLIEFILYKKKISREVHMFYKTLNIN